MSRAIQSSGQALIDAHIHFWDPSLMRYDWLRPIPQLHQRFTPDCVPIGRHAVAGYVFVQADCRADETATEVAWVSQLAEHHPILGIVAHAELDRGAAAREQLERLAAHPRIVGVRRLLQGEPETLIASEDLATGLGMLAEYGLTFDACVTHRQLRALTALVSRCEDVTVVLDHLGKPDVAGGGLDPWRADLAALARHPNVMCKLSGLTTEADQRAWTPEDLRPYLEHALETFGPGRCLVGSDWPVATLATSYERWFDMLLDFLSPLPAAMRAAVLAGNAARIYGLPA